MTISVTASLQSALDKANPNELADLLRKVKLGTVLTPLKRTFTGLTAAASYDLTALDASGETVGAANPKRLAMLALLNLSVVTATTASCQGVYVLADPAQTKISATNKTVVGVAWISDDGKTLTFPTADVTAFTIEYLPRASTDMATADATDDIGEP